MPGTVRSIIVGGGIAAGAPSTVGNIPMFSGANPPDILVDSILREVAGPPDAIIVGTTDPSAAALETFRTAGGFISQGAAVDSFIAGRGAFVAALSVGGIALGQGALLGTTGTTDLNDSVVIGAGSTLGGSTVATTALEANVIIGPRNIVSSASNQPMNNFFVLGTFNTITNTIGGTYNNVIAIGRGITANAPANLIVIGNPGAVFPAQAAGIAIGHNVRVDAGAFFTVIGVGARNVGGSDNTLLGRGATKQGATGNENILIGVLAVANTVDYTVVIGSQASVDTLGTGCIAIGRLANIDFANCLAIAPGATPSAANQCVLGSNNTGGDYRTFIFGQGPFQVTGGRDVLWRASDGSGANVAIGHLTVRPGLATGNGVGGDLILQTGTLGVIGSTLQTAAARITVKGGLATTQVFIGGDPGGTETLRVGGSLAINDPTRLVSNKQAFTDGAGIAAGTLANAPTVGNPTKWIAIDDAGTPRFIPCW